MCFGYCAKGLWILARHSEHPHLEGTDACLQLQAAALTLGIDTTELGDGNSSFNQLGGDSLAAIQFAREVDNLCGTTLPVSFVLDHSHSMKDIIEKVRFCICDEYTKFETLRWSTKFSKI